MVIPTHFVWDCSPNVTASSTVSAVWPERALCNCAMNGSRYESGNDMNVPPMIIYSTYSLLSAESQEIYCLGQVPCPHYDLVSVIGLFVLALVHTDRTALESHA